VSPEIGLEDMKIIFSPYRDSNWSLGLQPVVSLHTDSASPATLFVQKWIEIPSRAEVLKYSETGLRAIELVTETYIKK
jgi:hypothetical protein